MTHKQIYRAAYSAIENALEAARTEPVLSGAAHRDVIRAHVRATAILVLRAALSALWELVEVCPHEEEGGAK